MKKRHLFLFNSDIHQQPKIQYSHQAAISHNKNNNSVTTKESSQNSYRQYLQQVNEGNSSYSAYIKHLTNFAKLIKSHTHNPPSMSILSTIKIFFISLVNWIFGTKFSTATTSNQQHTPMRQEMVNLRLLNPSYLQRLRNEVSNNYSSQFSHHR